MMILVKFYLLAAVTGCCIGLSRAKAFDVPDIIIYGKPTDWFYVQYDQRITINNKTDESKNNTWSVEEYFTLDPATSVAFHHSPTSNNKYIVAASEGLFYHCRSRNDPGKDCKQDLRQGHDSLYPWRYSTRNQIGKISKALVGIGAIWKNALERLLPCTGVSNNLVCSLADKHLNWVMVFVRPRGGPLSIDLEQHHTLYEDGRSIVDSISTKMQVKSFKVSHELTQVEHLRVLEILSSCNSQRKYDPPTFPSLLRTIAQSAQKNYHLSYKVTTSPGRTRLASFESYSVEEWFSYTEGMQSFRSSRSNQANVTAGHHYYRLLGLKNRNMCVSYEVELVKEEVKSCRFKQFDDENLTKLPIFQRPIRFVSHEHSIGNTVDYYDKNLLGLGALLANIHDHRDKYLNYETPDYGGVALNEWIFDDSERSGRRYHLLFRRPSAGDLSSCHLDSLLKIQVYRKNLNDSTMLEGRSNEAQSIEIDGEVPWESVLDYTLELTIEIYKYSTYMYERDKIQAFEVPHKCPPAEDVSEDGYEQVSDTTDTGALESESDSEDFAEFDEILALDRNYRVSSTWTFESGRIMDLVEYLYFDDGSKVTRIDDLVSEESYFICYSSGRLYNRDGERCDAVDSIDEDLEMYSSPMTLYGLAGHCNGTRLYGVGSLLLLSTKAEKSQIEFLGEADLNGEVHRQWKIRMEKLGKDVIFRFAVEKGMTGDKVKLKLLSLTVKQADQTVLIIKDIKFGYASLSDVAIPPACNDTSDRSSGTQHKFPTFEQVLSRKPQEATFGISYDFSINTKGATHKMTVSESCKSRGDCKTVMQTPSGDMELRTFKDFAGSTDTFLFEPRNQRCAKLTKLMNLFALTETVKSFALPEEPWTDGALLVVNLWEAFGDKVTADGIVPIERDIALNDVNHVRYEWNVQTQVAGVSFHFEKKIEEPLTLSTIVITSSVLGNDTMTFSILSVSHEPPEKMDYLPQECRAVLDENRYIPVLSDAFKGSSVHMRSQMVRKGFIQQVDEWYESDTSYRFVVSNLVDSQVRTVADYLALRYTGELFNLVTPDECELITSHASADWFVEHILESQHEAKTYGPLFLWSLSEDSGTRGVQQVADDKLDYGGLFDRNRRNFLFNTELWSLERMQSPLLRAVIRFGRDGNSTQMLPEDMQVIQGKEAIASLEVLNLVQIEDAEYKKMLLLPKGKGCKRSKSAHDIWARGGLDSYSNHHSSLTWFRYLATLYQVQDSRLKPTLISQTGFIRKCPAMGIPTALASLKVSHWQVQDVGAGTLTSYRLVENRIEPRSSYVQTRILNRDTGSCMLRGPFEISQDSEVLNLDLAGRQGESIRIKDNILTSYEIIASGFEPIHRYEDENGSIVSVYEYRTSRIELNSRLIGPGSIIRTFVRPKNAERDQSKHYKYSSLRLEIVLLDQAHLFLDINDMGEPDCFDVWTEARPQDCHLSTAMVDALRYSGADAGNRLRTIGVYFTVVDDSSTDTSNVTATKSKDIARSIGLGLISEPYAVPPMQLGDIDVVFQDQENQLVLAYITLIEPPSPIHAFLNVPGMVLKRFGSKMLLHMRVVESIYECSEWCGSTDYCAAFSYCTDKMCSILTGTEVDYRNLTESYGEDKSSCSLYHKISDSSSKSVSQIIKLIQDDIDQVDSINKLSFTVPVGIDKSIKYVASRVEMVFDDELIDIGSPTEPLIDESTYVTVNQDRAFLLDDRTSSVSISFDLSRSLSECLNACGEAGAPLCSYCTRSEVCRVVTNVSSWKDYDGAKNDTDEDSMNRCTIYSIDYTKDYHRLRSTSRPLTYLRAGQNLSLVECAAMCSLGSKLDQADLGQCLSFDYCSDTTTDQSICYLQRIHLSMTDFSETAYANKSAPNDRCHHYSKNLLSDFDLLKGKQFRLHETIKRASMTLDKCATLCHLDPEENCMGFEYCHKQGTQRTTCYIKKYYYAEAPSNSTDHAEIIDAQDCSVYLLRNNSLNNDYPIIEEPYPDNLLDKANAMSQSQGWLAPLGWFPLIMYSILALFLGVAVRRVSVILRLRCHPRRLVAEN